MVDVDAGFATAMFQAIDQDPVVNDKKNKVAEIKAKLRTTEAGKETQINATILGGIEDISDETVGVAALLTANRMLYDGGMLQAQIDAENFYVKSAEQAYSATRGMRALNLAHAWIELERYQSLQALITKRLTVLDPLLLQLERVASSGVGDVSQVAAAQRIVSMILAAEIQVSGSLKQAQIDFINRFGLLPVRAKYDDALVSNAIPTSATKDIVENSPGLLSKYWDYRAAEASVVAVEAKNEFRIGFKLNLQRPFGGSGANSDESVGFALSKDFYRGDQLKSQVVRAEAAARSKAAEVLSGYREGDQKVSAAREKIKSINKALGQALSNAESSREEIDYLKKQLIIGGSTLESVLAAEARLYESESMEIGFIAERRKAEFAIIAMSGQFTKALISE